MVSKILAHEAQTSAHVCRYLCDDLASLSSLWLVRVTDNGSFYQVVCVMERISHLESFQPAHFFSVSPVAVR